MRAGELCEIGGDVRPRLVATVDAADAAGGHDVDACQTAGGECCPYRRRAERAVDDAGGEIAWADLACFRARGSDSLQLLVVEAHVQSPVHYRGGRRYGAAVAYALLALPSDGQPLAGRKAMGDDRRLQGNDRPHPGDGVLDIGRVRDDV